MLEQDESQWLSIRQASVLVSVTKKTIRNWLRRNLITGEFSQGLRRWRVHKSSLLAFVEYKNENKN